MSDQTKQDLISKIRTAVKYSRCSPQELVEALEQVRREIKSEMDFKVIETELRAKRLYPKGFHFASDQVEGIINDDL